MRKKTEKGPFCLGLTGSIGMGKSTAAKMFSDMGVPVFCADKAVHEILENEKKTISRIEKVFPDVVQQGKVDRGALGKIALKDTCALMKLEKILHPRVESARKKFLLEAQKKKSKIVVFDIPLLFETGGQENCHVVLCVSAPKSVQKQRIMKRKTMSVSQLRVVLNRQFSDAQKRNLADFVIWTDKGKAIMRRQIKALYVVLEKVF